MDNSLPAQERAIAHVAARSEGGPIDPALRVTLNFHPDRRVGEVPILQAMALDGLYRSQFETGTSNGGLTAHPGGDRWSWESRIFGNAYDECRATLWMTTWTPKGVTVGDDGRLGLDLWQEESVASPA